MIVGVSPNFVGQASMLEMQVRVDIVLVSLQSLGKANRVETRAGMIWYSPEAEFLLLWGTSVLLLRLSTDWMS